MKTLPLYPGSVKTLNAEARANAGLVPACAGTLRLTLPRRQKVLYCPKTGTVLFGRATPY